MIYRNTLFILLLIILNNVFASDIVDISNPKNFLGLRNVNGAMLIESCIEDDCVLFPSETAPHFGFKGTEEQWSEYFEHCSQFDIINNVAFGAEIAIDVVTFKVLSYFKLMIYGSKILTGIFLSGVSYAKETSPYPSVSYKNSKMISKYYKSLLRKNGNYLEEKEMLVAVTELFDRCSFGFRNAFQRRELIKSQKMYYENKSKEKVFPYPHSQLLDLEFSLAPI